jgi:hypothetical protein
VLTADVNGIKVIGKDTVGHLADERLRTWPVALDGEAVACLPTFSVHRAHGVGFAVGVDPHRRG